MVCDAGLAGVDLRATEVLRRHVLAGRGLHEWRATQEDRARALDDDGLVAHRRDVGATGRAAAHDQRDLGDGRGRHAGLVVEDPPEVVAVREHVGLEGKERAAAVDEIDAGQLVLERDLLRAQVLLDGHRVVGAALDGRVVRDDDAGRALHTADAGDDPGARRVVVVEAGGGQRAQFQERAAWVQESIDPLADRELATFAVTLDGPVIAPGTAVRRRPPGAPAGRRRGRPSRRGSRASRRRRGRAGCAGRACADDRSGLHRGSRLEARRPFDVRVVDVSAKPVMVTRRTDSTFDGNSTKVHVVPRPC